MTFGRTGRVAAAVALLASPALLLLAPGVRAFQMAPRQPDPAKRDAPPQGPAAQTVSSPFHFVDVAAQAGLERVVLAGRPGKDHLLDSAGTGAAWLDYDRDGLLDCYIVNDWTIDGDKVGEKGRNALYRQRKDHSFEDVTDAAGVGGEGEWGAGVFVADYDRDGWPDMLVTNFGRNVLYRNLGNGRFENVAGEGRPRVCRAGTRAQPGSMPTPTATSTSTSRSTSTPRSTRSSRRSRRCPGAASRWWLSAPSA